MSETKRKVPKLRFPGFTEDWEQRKVSEVFKITRGQVLAANLTSDKKTEINKYPVFSSQTKDNGLMGYYSEFLFENAITWTTDGANAGTVRYRKGKFYSTNVNGVLLNDDGLACTALSEIIDKVAYKYVSHVGNPKLMNNVMANIDIIIPNDKEELIQISKIIETFDKSITLHQRKLENLKLKKKALLQKLFPKNGEQFPELRFPGFTDAWEQRKFTYLLDKKEGIRRGPFGSALKKSSFVKESKYTVYEQQNAIYDRFDTRYNITKEKFDELYKFQLTPGDFIMSGAGTIGRIARVPTGIKAGVFNQALIRFKIDETLVDSEYFLEWIRSEGMQKEFTKANPGSAMVNLVPMSEVKEWEVLLPTKDEQYKIGSLLSKISSLITLHQRKLEHLQLQKKALLQQMFV